MDFWDFFLLIMIYLRCIESCDAVGVNQTIEFDIFSHPHTLSKSDFFGNYFVISPNFPVAVIVPNTKLNPEFIPNYTTDEQILVSPGSRWKPWSMQERFNRFEISNSTESFDKIGVSKNDDALEIRSLMVDVARNFHSLETLKV